MAGTANELQQQWTNPSDVMSLLLLIGGDVVQKAIAQLVGRTIRPFRTCEVGITPVAFSFGWVAYAFTNLLSAVGEKQLMPAADQRCIVVNSANGIVRTNRSWIIGRLLRDHEERYKVDPSDESPRGADSVRIDIFELWGRSKPTIDAVWWFGWLVMVIQVIVAIVPWVLHGNWGTMMIVLSGNLLAVLFCSLPQWREEKWAGRTLKSDKVTCITRGNGHHHIMVLIGRSGSWDLEALATATCQTRPETTIASLVLTLLWTCFLISVSGLQEDAWYLVCVGGIGMLQNIHAAGRPRHSSAFDIHLTQYAPMPTIIGKRQAVKDDPDAHVELDATMDELSEVSEWLKKEDSGIPEWLDQMDGSHKMPAWLVPLSNRPGGKDEIENVQGALMELERWVPTAGLAMLQIFFPSGLCYKDESIKYNMQKKFWKKAYHVQKIRRKAEEKRRHMRKERSTGGGTHLV
ncbi:hypothetical protein BDV25DRAFT_152779 [Aspergillus avenaceus]|uniref:Uncharacterized protein n=1 Tax=Aspergillus avenaceus TaxID=36643 RepID=A0A5N6TYZ8_ASPAV|nr:hypothetical protein BDV25DRAFT_152779 [Aspergillus avenaceus]